jgi:hypothetical protein
MRMLVTIVPLASHSCNEGFLQRSQEALGIPFQSTIRSEIHGKFTYNMFHTLILGRGGFFRAWSSWKTTILHGRSEGGPFKKAE